jgi:hypothetical protein
LVVCCVMLAMSLIDVFVTGAGFGIYLNNRTWLEGWDVELAFRQLSSRLGKMALLALVASLVWMPAAARAQEDSDPAEIIREVKSHEDFKVHTVIDKVPKQKESKSTSWEWPAMMEFLLWIGKAIMWLLAAAFVTWIIWLLWKNRDLRPRLGEKTIPDIPKARVVMGMDVSPETLPADIPAAALALWRQGRHREALALLYRGAISRVIETARVEIRESDTEGDCLRRVEQAGAAAQPDYFRGITGAWMRLAYARMDPNEIEIEALCLQWPFAERRQA